MKNVKHFIAGLILLITLQLNAQVLHSIQGKVSNQEGPVEFASVELLKDSASVKTVMTDHSGFFKIEGVQMGVYQLRITAVGFEPAVESIEVKENENVSQNIKLNPSSKQLSAVTVTSQRKLIEVRADKTVINVDASPTNAGANALEVLEKSPGVMVDNDGNISLAGKSGVNVMIDGKPVSMSSRDLSNYLKSLNASQLDQIELITQPNSKYDAQGNAGIINIKLKRNKVKGMNGNIGASYTQGQYGRFNSNAFLGYRSGKWNVTGSYSGVQHAGFNEINVTRYFRKKSDHQLQSIFDQSTFLKFTGNNYQVKAGVDFIASEKTTLGLNLQKGTNHLNFDVPTVMKIYDPNKTYTGQAITKGVNKLDNENLTLNFNFRIKFDSLGRELTGDADYAQYSDNGRQQLDNYFYDAQGVENAAPYLLKGHNPSLFNIYSAKLDYTHPVGKTLKFESGIKGSYVYSDHESSFLNKNSGEWEIDDRTNHFLYTENINAVYINGTKTWDKLQLQLGLRVENTRANGNQKTTNEKFDRNYTHAFPTAFISYKFNDKHSVNANWGRRVTRPDYTALNPFQMLLNPYTYQMGNPLLRPQFSYNGELGYVYKNGLLTAKLGYSEITDIISDILTQDETTTTSYVQPQNLAHQNNLLLQVNLNVSPKKWWSTQVFLSGNNQQFKGMLSGYYYETKFNSFNININNQFKFGKGWSGELGGFYQHKNLFSGNSVIQPFGMLNAGISKQVLNNKGTIKLNARDILSSRRIQIDQNYYEFESYFTNRIDSRVFTLGFTWRFAKNEKNVLQQRSSGASAEEINRAGKN